MKTIILTIFIVCAFFVIGPSEVISHCSLDPQSPWYTGCSYLISWDCTCTTVFRVNVFLTWSGGTENICLNQPEQGSCFYTVPSWLGGEFCRVCVACVDGSNSECSPSFQVNNFDVQITSPQTGDCMCYPCTFPVVWTTSPCAHPPSGSQVSYRCDGGPWEPVTCNKWSERDDKAECSLQVPDTNCLNSELKIDYSGYSDISGPFRIMACDTVLVAPNGGEMWLTDSTYWITWHPCFYENVSIEYSYSCLPDSWYTIEADYPNYGEYAWTIPDIPPGACRVRICGSEQTDCCDISDLPFCIGSATPLSYYKIETPDHWYHPPLKVTPGGSRNLMFKLYSIGCANLIWSAGSADPCILGSAGGTLPPGDSAWVTFTVDGSGQCNGTFIDGTIHLSTNEGGGTTDTLPVQAVVANDYYECPIASVTFDSMENGILAIYVNANSEERIYDVGTFAGETHRIFYEGCPIVATIRSDGAVDTLVGRFVGEDYYTGPRDSLYRDECNEDWEPDFWIVYTKNIFIHDLNPPANYTWFWWELSKQMKFFKDSAPDDYKRLVIEYVKVRRHDPPNWWPDQTPFINYENTYVGLLGDIDCPSTSVDGQKSLDSAGYDEDTGRQIMWQRGWDESGGHPEYNDYHCGIALAEGGITKENIVPYGAHNVLNDDYVQSEAGWTWDDGELYMLACDPGVTVDNQDSIADRSWVMTAQHIDAGSDPNAEASFTVILAAAPNGMVQLQALVDTGRAIVAREALKGFPVLCGDANYDQVVGAGDVVYLLSYLFRGEPPPPCPMIGRADCNLDGKVGAGDVVFLLSYLFRGGPAPVCPGVWGP